MLFLDGTPLPDSWLMLNFVLCWQQILSHYRLTEADDKQQCSLPSQEKAPTQLDADPSLKKESAKKIALLMLCSSWKLQLLSFNSGSFEVPATRFGKHSCTCIT